MSERNETGHKFRGHHAPGRAFEFLNSLCGGDRKRIIDKFYISVDWAKSGKREIITSWLKTDIKKNEQKGLTFQASLNNDDYIEDTLGSDYPSRLARVDKIIQTQTADIDILLFGDPNQKVIIVSLKD